MRARSGVRSRAAPPVAIAVLFVTAAAPTVAGAQPDLGHKIPGSLGLDAGTQPDPGVYAGYRLFYYDAIRVRDRGGETLPLAGFDLDAIVNAVGVAGTLRLRRGLHLGAAVAVPFAHLSVSIDEPQGEVDRFGLGDVFVKPLQLGGRWSRLDLVASYAFYVPTRQINREGLGAPQWSHQLAAGGTVWFDAKRRWRTSALFDYTIHQRKLGVDVTRGDLAQIQGGIGRTLLSIVEVGVVGYGLWQVTDDRGSDLPEALRGRRDRAYGLGAEIDVVVPRLRTKIGLRYARDLSVRGRPEGQLVVLSVSLVLGAPWKPPRR